MFNSLKMKKYLSGQPRLKLNFHSARQYFIYCMFQNNSNFRFTNHLKFSHYFCKFKIFIIEFPYLFMYSRKNSWFFKVISEIFHRDTFIEFGYIFI